MGGLSYDTCDSVVSDDEDGRDQRPRVAVRKQAEPVSAVGTHEAVSAAAEEARKAQEDLAKLQAKAEELQRKMEAHRQQMVDTRSEGDDLDSLPSSSPSSPSAAQAGAAAARRRGLDLVRAVEAERVFETRTGENSEAPDGGRGEVIAKELRSAAVSLLEKPCWPAPDEGDVPEARKASSSNSAAKSTLRRLKQLEPAVASAIEQECGVNLSKSDAFRLILDTPESRLKPQTKALLVVAGEQFICEELKEPIPEELSPDEVAAGTVADSASIAAAGMGDGADCRPEPASSEGCEDAGAVADGASIAAVMVDEADRKPEPASLEGGEDVVEAELRFFRSAPKQGPLARKLGKVPALHVTLAMDGQVQQSWEFIGVHQRRYCDEHTPSDAISQNLTESLLLVVLEFVFHPSRSRYSRGHLVVRECSTCPEVRRESAASLPLMLDRVLALNKKIHRATVETGPSPARLHNAKSEKQRSFLILDEDVLKVAPAKASFSKAPSAKGAFKGFGAGFLNKSSAKRHGLSKPAQEAEEPPPLVPSSTAELPASTSSSSSGAVPQSSVTEQIEVGERTRINDLPEQQGPPPVQTDAEEKHGLLLGSADVKADITEDVRAFRERAEQARVDDRASATVLAQDAESLEEDAEQNGAPASLSELANQLFGDLLTEQDDLDNASQASEPPERTASTHTPSPTAGASRDGAESRGAPSERSEHSSATMVETDPAAGTGAQPRSPAATGLRLLQQRRREANASGSNTQAADSNPGSSSGGASESQPVRDECEELVKLWLKQRW